MSNIKTPFSKYIVDHDKEYALQEIFIKIFNYFCSSVDSNKSVNLEHVGLALLRESDDVVKNASLHEVDNPFDSMIRTRNYYEYVISYIKKRISFVETRKDDLHLNRLSDNFYESKKYNTGEELDIAIHSNTPVGVCEYKADINELIEGLVVEGRKTESLYKALLEAAFLCFRIQHSKDPIRYQALSIVHLEHVSELLNITISAEDEMLDILNKDQEDRKLLGTDDPRTTTSRH